MDHCESLFSKMNTQNFKELQLYDVTTNKTYNLKLDADTANRAEQDTALATEILQRYLNAHNLNNDYEEIQETGISSQNTTDISTDILEEQNEVDKGSHLGSQNESSNATNWTRNETLELLNAYDIFKENFNHARKRKHVWTTIQTYLESRGIVKSEKVIENKWKNLLRTYKVIKDQNNKTGRGAVKFQFMDEMENILGKRPIINSPDAVGIGLPTVKPSSDDNQIKDVPLLSENNIRSVVSLENTDNKPKENDDTNLKKRKQDQGNPDLRKTYIKMKIDELKDKKEKRKEYLNFLKDEQIKKRERDEKLITLRERELDIEDRKVKAIEKIASSPNPNFRLSNSTNPITNLRLLPTTSIPFLKKNE